jgi:DNA-binding XRE family transcriptional regulator
METLAELAEMVLMGLEAQEALLLRMADKPLKAARICTQEEMAERCELSQGAISQIEQGHYDQVSLATLCRVIIVYAESSD